MKTKLKNEVKKNYHQAVQTGKTIIISVKYGTVGKRNQ